MSFMCLCAYAWDPKCLDRIFIWYLLHSELNDSNISLSRKIIQILQTTSDPESEGHCANKDERYNFGGISENAEMH